MELNLHPSKGPRLINHGTREEKSVLKLPGRGYEHSSHGIRLRFLPEDSRTSDPAGVAVYKESGAQGQELGVSQFRRVIRELLLGRDAGVDASSRDCKPDSDSRLEIAHLHAIGIAALAVLFDNAHRQVQVEQSL
ncbi:hypothetical protein PT974_09534 [Cladobotryum mycophilum]|uniref:Uncharacterized protein n=1 Tax=Cladobotryum mycophilum TaxID=491253 RepID=A0ABR0SGE3_9HYPO